ncbi:hypothetical protein [Sphingosinithalassobacter portus]|uniref:ATPase, T2SS/T4P/T4SS family n=1 Tax=Stakelama portus TaxID=2676234 RepID=UPI000D6DD73B|nr:hypothetical protein [Sphingosinithalassobacter portus]
MRSSGEGVLLSGRDEQSKQRAPGDSIAAFESLLMRARALGADAVHFEPLGEDYSVRARISGALVEMLRAGPRDALSLIAAARRSAEPDGGYSLHARSFAEGERLLLTLPPEPDLRAPLSALGMPPPLAAIIEAAAVRGRGLVLFAGPPGAGVTRSLETMSALAARGVRRVLRRADATNTDDSLESLLDLDPDVLRIDTLTSHDLADPALTIASEDRLVLAGIDAPNTVSAISRLALRHHDRFRLASNLRVVVSQRLARRLCRHCRVPQQATGSESALLGFDSGSVVYAAGGCDACGGTGYAGITGVYGWVQVDSAMARLIDGGADAVLLTRHASLTGPSPGTSARAMVRDGVITAADAVRISRETTSTVTT